MKYPILVVSGVLAQLERLAYARECAGPRLNVRFMAKPFSGEVFLAIVRQRLAGGQSKIKNWKLKVRNGGGDGAVRRIR